MKPIESIFVDKPKWYSSSNVEKLLLLSSDVVALAVAFFLSHALLGNAVSADLLSPGASMTATQLYSYAALAAAGLAIFSAQGHYSKRRPFSSEVRETLGLVLGLALMQCAAVVLGKWEFSRAALLLNWLLVPGLVLVGRAVLKRSLIGNGAWVRPMVIVGWGENAHETASAFDDEYLMGYEIRAFLVPRGAPRLEQEYIDRDGRLVPCISLGDYPERTLANLGNPHVVVALEQGGIDTYQDLIKQLSLRHENMQIVPSHRGLPLYGTAVSHFFGHDVMLLTLRNNLSRPFPKLLKRAFDIAASSALIIAGAPLLLWICAKVLASGRPVFYGHRRVGQNQKSFLCYKFRTMAPNADQLLKELLARDPAARAEWERDFKLKDDPRVTPIGRWLRKTSLDELPQLWNVLRGDMSLVGPRPVVTAELERYGNQVDYYLQAKPGITGLWQISGRNDITYDSRVYLDAWYVKNWSMFNDIKILFKTLKVVTRKEGAY